MSRGEGHVVDVQRWMSEYQDSLRLAGVDVKAVATNPEHADRVKDCAGLAARSQRASGRGHHLDEWRV
jgi:hypothetical protein